MATTSRRRPPLGIVVPSKKAAPTTPKVSTQAPQDRAPDPQNGARARNVGGKRVTVDQAGQMRLQGPGLVVLQPPTEEVNRWQLVDLDTNTFSKIAPARLLEMLTDASPDLSKALWDFLRFCNPGYEITAITPGSTDDTPDVRGQVALDAVVARLERRYVTLDVLFSRMFFGVFMRGALVLEVVIGGLRNREVVDLAIPDAASIRFRRADDPETGGERWVPFQWQDGKPVDLDVETVLYVPVDPMVASPYGRSMAAPAIFPTLFLVGLLHDLRRVVAQQGYPRIDVSIVMERLQAMLPEEDREDEQTLIDFVGAAIAEVNTTLKNLQPDDTYVHTDVVEMNKPIGAVDSSSLSAVDGLIMALERLATRALKSMPLLMGTAEGTSEANANRQWEIHVAGIKAIQHLVENALGRLLTLGCQAMGVVTNARVTFAELRASEEMRDQQTLALKVQNWAAIRDQGWADQDEAAQEVVGHPAVEQTSLLVQQAQATLDATLAAKNTQQAGLNQNPEPGDNRGMPQLPHGGPYSAQEVRDVGQRIAAYFLAAAGISDDPETRAPVQPAGSALPTVPFTIEYHDSDAERAANAFDDAEPQVAGLLDAEVVSDDAE